MTTAMTNEGVISLLVERGTAGVSLREVAATDPRTRERLLDFSDFDTDDLEPIHDLGPRGIDTGVAIGALLRLTNHPGAVLDLDKSLRQALVYLDDPIPPDLLDARARLVGWSGLPPESRSLPYEHELDIADPADLLAAFLLAAGPAGTGRDNVAWWTTRAEGDADLWRDAVWYAAIATLIGRGWDIRYDRRSIQVVATPDHPMRPPGQRPGPIVVHRYTWPGHSYHYTPDLWAAIYATEQDPRTRTSSWIGGTYGHDPAVPVHRSYAQPAWDGEPIPGGEERRARLVAWAREHGHTDVARLATAGTVRLVIDD